MRIVGSGTTTTAPPPVTSQTQPLIDAFNFTSGRMSKDEATRNQKYFNELLSANRLDDAKAFIKSIVIANIPSDQQGKVIGRDQAIAALKDIQGSLVEYQKAGGDTGLITGSFETIAQKLGRTTDPKLARIANDVTLAIQAYRQAISGAAFTESESKQYESVFPSIGKGSELNQSKIDSLMATFDRNNRIVVETVIGGNNYDKIFSTFPSSISGTTQTSTGFEWQSPLGNMFKLPY